VYVKLVRNLISELIGGRVIHSATVRRIDPEIDPVIDSDRSALSFGRLDPPSGSTRSISGFSVELCRRVEITTVCSKKSDAKIEIIITATNLTIIKYPLSSLNYHLSGANVANFNKIHCTVFEQQLFKKWSSKTEVSNMEKLPYQFVRNITSYGLCSEVVTICTDICMSLVQTVRSLLLTDFLSADPVAASICRRSRSSAEQDQSLSGNSSNNFLAL